MATLAETVASAAQHGVDQQGKTVGDAMQAYHIAATAEHARQELEMQKQESAMNKAKWAQSQLDYLSRREDGPLKNKMIESFGTQAKQIFEGFNPDVLDVLKHRPDLTPQMTKVMGQYASGQNVDDWSQVGHIFSVMPQDLVQAMEKARQEELQKQGAQLKAQALVGRTENMQDSNVERVSDKWDKDPNLGKLLAVGQPLGRDYYNIQKAKKTGEPITYQMLNEAIQSTSNALAPGSGVSDFRVKEITPLVSDKLKTEIQSAAFNNPNLPAAPQYQKYVENVLNRVYDATRADMAMNADRLNSGITPDSFHNKEMFTMHQNKYKFYRSGQALVPPDEATIKSLKGGSVAESGVRMKDPQGNIRIIPKDQVEAAKAAGGTIAGEP